ncbi:MAG: hypothetical protein RIR51_885 [Bacteroidota bacterium]
MKTKGIFISIIILFFLGLSYYFINLNTEEDALPRPKGYPRMNIPEHQYELLSTKHPYQFEKSKIAVEKPDSISWAEPHWIYLYYPDWEGYIQLTYKPLNKDRQKLRDLINDAYKLAYGHQKKANLIEPKVMTLKNGKKAGIFELNGEIATAFQFFITDSTNHYLRGAVYVKTATENDSLAPVIQYMKEDAIHLLETLEFKN